MRRGKTTGRNLRATPAVAHVDSHFTRPYPLRGAGAELIRNKLRVKDSLTAQEGYQDTVRTMTCKPYPAIERMRNVQRLLKTQNPRVGDVNLEDLFDNLYIRKLDESDFLERIGVKCTWPETSNHACRIDQHRLFSCFII
jgi:hypothetical protein